MPAGPTRTGWKTRGVRDRIETSSGLLLRPWCARDVTAVLNAFAEPVMRRQAARPVGSAADAERWLEEREASRAAGSSFAFAVVGADGAVLGNVQVAALDRTHGTGWVSYWTTAPARGRGAATGGLRALVPWAFRELGLFRLELGHRTDNPASCRVARAAGFAVEGLQRQKLAYDGVRYDVELHARPATDPEPAQRPRP
ncbi:putative ribosomal N-acetyltransferase YdaF [Streptomyces sp. ADI95-17]|uniref:GNAT family N-acetyltransferase n=1 Tax=Streptomyces sp. NBC_01732 TaxID=2975926 RepID=UPI000F5BBCD6|nr:putative ribosomal N-acetyltransferase YdaF [Streptomyces sp. ADI95-17]